MYALDGSLQFVSLLVVLTVRMQLGTPVGRSVSHDEPENKDSAATLPAGVSKWHKEAATSTLRPVKRYQRPMRLVAGQLAQVQARDSKVLDESVKPTYTVSSPCSGKTVVALSHISFAVRGEGATDGAVVVVGISLERSHLVETEDTFETGITSLVACSSFCWSCSGSKRT